MAHDIIIIIDSTKKIAEDLTIAGDKSRHLDTLLANNLYTGNEQKAHDNLLAYQQAVTAAEAAIKTAKDNLMNC